MPNLLTLLLASSALLQAPSVSGAAVPTPRVGAAAYADGFLGRDWIVRASDNVCGLRDANQLTRPALIDFEACLAATPEMKKIESQGIDPKSAEGIQLRSAAVTRLTQAAEATRSERGHCSVWKEIRHKDGRAVDDLTSQVIAQY
jgi:hypothetical protein